MLRLRSAATTVEAWVAALNRLAAEDPAPGSVVHLVTDDGSASVNMLHATRLAAQGRLRSYHFLTHRYAERVRAQLRDQGADGNRAVVFGGPLRDQLADDPATRHPIEKISVLNLGAGASADLDALLRWSVDRFGDTTIVAFENFADAGFVWDVFLDDHDGVKVVDQLSAAADSGRVFLLERCPVAA